MSQTKTTPRLELLTSWKEIANYLGKGVRTVQRWEAMLGLPVIRPADSRSGIVMARPGDLEAWLVNGRRRLQSNPDLRGLKNDNARTTFMECVEELRRYQQEVQALCREMHATRDTLQLEIERLKFLYAEWDSIRDQGLGEENAPELPPEPAKPN